MLAARLVSIPATAAVTLAGVWVAGGVLTNDYRASIVLTTVWFAAAGAAALLLARRRRSLRTPVLATYAVTAVATGAVLGFATFTDRVVAERLDRGAAVRSAAFTGLEHDTQGRAGLVRRADGRLVLQLTGFRTSPGPDLRVRLVPGATNDGAADGAVDLGALKGNRGDQQYRVPRLPRGPLTVLIWCRAFSAPFGAARL